MQPLEAHRAMPEERPPGTGPEPSLGELPGDDQRLAAEGKQVGLMVEGGAVPTYLYSRQMCTKYHY